MESAFSLCEWWAHSQRMWSSQVKGEGEAEGSAWAKAWKDGGVHGMLAMTCGLPSNFARLHWLFPPEMQKTEHTSAPLPPTGCSGVGRGRVVPVHCCSMAWTWASVNSQQYASFFHSWGRRCLEASRHSTEWNCCVSCRWSCLKVKFFPEGSLGSLHNTWSCGADPKSVAATRGDIPARLSLGSLDGVLASSQAWGFWFLTLCLALTSRTPAAHIVPPSRTPFLTSLSLNPITTVKRPSTCHLFQEAFPIPLFSLCSHSTSASRRTQQLWLTPVKPRIRYISRFAESQQVVKGGVTEFFLCKAGDKMRSYKRTMW